MVANGLMLKRAIIIKLLEVFASEKASNEHGYYVAVTSLDKIGEGKIKEDTGEVSFSVLFSGITFTVFKDEIVQAVVHKVSKYGVFLKCGPIENMFLSYIKMPDYKYIPGENPIFMNEQNSRIQVGDKVRVSVLKTRWIKERRELQALASLEGDCLGPI